MKGFTLFLDRDGVINDRLVGDYVLHRGDFRFMPGVLEALRFFAGYFGRIIVVTNQQGIGKGLMTEADIQDIHKFMLSEIRQAGGRVDAVYYCPDLQQKPDNCRKPGPAMAFQAQRDFPEIEFSESVMVGDSISDIDFGFLLGMRTVLIEGKAEEALALENAAERVHFRYTSLWALAMGLRELS